MQHPWMSSQPSHACLITSFFKGFFTRDTASRGSSMARHKMQSDMSPATSQGCPVSMEAAWQEGECALLWYLIWRLLTLTKAITSGKKSTFKNVHKAMECNVIHWHNIHKYLRPAFFKPLLWDTQTFHNGGQE